MGTDTVLYAAQRMLASRTNALVVIDDRGRAAGVVTSDDLVVRCVARKRPPDSTTLVEVMTRPVSTVRDDTQVDVALELMAKEGVARLVIVDARDRVTGVVSLDDLLWGIVEGGEGLGPFQKLRGMT